MPLCHAASASALGPANPLRRIRQQYLISGEPVAEPDFEQMHASILYAKRGLRLEGDAYETGEFPRDVAKLAFNVALNAKSLPGAIAALTGKPNWALSSKATARLLKVLKHRHAPIADDLHSDKGIRLMRLDSGSLWKPSGSAARPTSRPCQSMTRC